LFVRWIDIQRKFRNDPAMFVSTAALFAHPFGSKITIARKNAQLAGRMRIILLIGIAAPLCLAQLQNSSQLPSPRVALDEVLSWLPEDTETVMGANGVFPLTDPNVEENARVRPFLTELNLRTQTLPLSLLLFNNGGLSTFLKGKPVLLAIEGSRNFRAPKTRGAMHYEGCEIVVFSNEVKLDWTGFRQMAASTAVQFEQLEGTDVAVFEEESGSDNWTTLVAFPRSNILLVATDRDYLHEVLSRMRKPPARRALPDDLLEWKYVDTGAKVWGLRHYSAGKAELDPTSPFARKARANVPDPDAVGATFWFEPDQQSAVVTYVSLNPDADQILVRHLRRVAPEENDVRVSEVRPGVVQATAALSGLDTFYRLMFRLMALMGHAVY
jgi:hypothetical protein